jgi:hypothetical protein
LDSWALGLLGPWALGLLGSWALGPLGSWALGLLGPWALGPLGSWALFCNEQLQCVIFPKIVHYFRAKNILEVGSGSELWNRGLEASYGIEFSELSHQKTIFQKRVLESEFSKASSRKRVLKIELSKASSQKRVLESEFSKVSSQKQVYKTNGQKWGKWHTLCIVWALDAPCFLAGILTFIYIPARWHHWLW